MLLSLIKSSKGEDTLFGRDGIDPGRVISREAVGEVCAQAVVAFDSKTSSSSEQFTSRTVEIVQSENVASKDIGSIFL